MPLGPPEAGLPTLSPEERARYRRHLMLPELGEAGQRRLKAARVLLVGAGGLGSPVALYLAAAGVGTLGIAEFDAVDAGNLQRQVLYGTGDVGHPKGAAARDRLRDLNPNVEVRVHEARLDAGNARELLLGYDLAIDATDNLAARYALSDACVALGRPLVHGSVFRFEGQVALLAAPGGPCYRCLHPEPPLEGSVPAAADVGVLGVVPGLVGLLQASEAVKWIAGIGEPLVGRLLLVDALRPELRTVKLPRDPACPACAPPASVAGRRPMTGVEYGPAVLTRLRDLAEEDPARERCGLVTRVGGRLEVLPVPNVAADPTTRFDMDPAALLRIHGELAASGGEIVAAWHSHVEGGAAFSARDRGEAVAGGRPLLPGAEQLVLGMRAGKVTELRRYRFSAGAYVELPLAP